MSETPAEAAKPKGSKKLIMIGAAVLLVAGGGGYYWYAQKAAAAAAAAEAEAAEEEDEEGGDHDEVDDHEGDEKQADHAKKKKKKAKKKKKKGHNEHTKLMSFEPFVVNLADPNAARFLRTNVQLVIAGGEEEGGGGGHGGGAKGPSVEEMRARSAILELLSAQTSDHLTTPDGKAELKDRIIERMQDVLEGAEIEDVLFSDFVIQF